jgi:hypothetical protein
MRLLAIWTVIILSSLALASCGFPFGGKPSLLGLLG